MTDLLEKRLDEIGFLREVPHATRRELVELAICHEYPKGNLLCYHGDPNDAVYLLLGGRVKITMMNDDGREVVLNVLRPPGMFGLIAALDGGTHIGTAMTLEPCRIARFSRDGVLRWLARHPEVYVQLSGELARMLRQSAVTIAELALLPVKGRLLRALLEIARSEGQTQQDDAIVFRRPTHQELAERVGSTRTVVARILKDLIREEEALRAEGNVIRVYARDLVNYEEI